MNRKREDQSFSPAFREVPKTGVIYVMSEATERGFSYGNAEWANLGQGAPECHAHQEGPSRLQNISLDDPSSEYSPVAGVKELREAVAHLYNERYRKGLKSKYTYENVAISSGGRSGLTRIAAAIGNVNLGHFLPDYTAYEELLGIFRNFISIPIVLDPQEHFKITSKRIHQEIIGKGLSALLFSNPSNPTGNVIYGDELHSIIKLANEFQCTMIIDEFYSHYIYGAATQDGSTISAARYIEDVNRDPIVIVDGLTKNWRYPGLRLSWTVAPKEIISRISSAGSFLDGGACHPVQKAAIELLDPQNAQREAESIQKVFNVKRDFVVEKLKTMSIAPDYTPEGGFYFFPNLATLKPEYSDGMKFFKEALEQKVITVPGAFFDVDPGQRRRHIPSRLMSYLRLSYGPTLSELERGMDRLQKMLS